MIRSDYAPRPDDFQSDEGNRRKNIDAINLQQKSHNKTKITMRRRRCRNIEYRRMVLKRRSVPAAPTIRMRTETKTNYSRLTRGLR